MDQNLKTAIYKTLAFFDIFDYPLTAQELYRFLLEDKPSADAPADSFIDFLHHVDELVHAGDLHRTYSYITLPGREDTIERRRRNVLLVEQKIAIALRAIRKITWIPFLRGVFLCNTVSFGWPKKESDIDVFIVVQEKRIWLTRLFITMSLSLFGLRRNKKTIADKICLSFYATDEQMDLSDIALPDPVLPDIYLMYWIAHLTPLYDPGDMYKKIMRNNVWIREYMPRVGEYAYSLTDRWRISDRGAARTVRRALEAMWSGGYGSLLEDQARTMQKAKMKSNYESVQNEPDTRVVISDTRLKFHENDRRELFYTMWRGRCASLGV